MSNLYPILFYQDTKAAVEFLTKNFGFEVRLQRQDAAGHITHAEIGLGSDVFVVSAIQSGGPLDGHVAPRRNAEPSSQAIYLSVADVDAHYNGARLGGAQIVMGPTDMTPCASREYAARDSEGHLWRFGTYRPGRPRAGDAQSLFPTDDRAPVEIPPGPLQRYLDHLDRLGIHDVVVTGGAVRDALLGREPHDIDVGVKLSLPEPLERELRQKVEDGCLMQALNYDYQLFYRMEQAIDQHARRVGLSAGWKSVTRDGQFEGIPVQFCFGSAVVAGSLVNLSASAYFTIDAMALDTRRRLYQAPSQDGLADLRERRLRPARPGWNEEFKPSAWTLWTILRALRYQHQDGFHLDFEPRLLEEAARRLKRPKRDRFATLRSMVLLDLALAGFDPTFKKTHQRYALRRLAWYVRGSWRPATFRERKWFDRFVSSVPRERLDEAIESARRLNVFATYPEFSADAAKWR